MLHSWGITLQLGSASRHSSYSNCSVACKMTGSVSAFPDVDHKQGFNEGEAKRAWIDIPWKPQPRSLLLRCMDLVRCCLNTHLPQVTLSYLGPPNTAH